MQVQQRLSLTLTEGFYSDRHLLSPTLISGLPPGPLRHSALIHATVCDGGGSDLKLEGGPVHFLQPCISEVIQFPLGSTQLHGAVLLHASHKHWLCLVLWDMPPGHSQEILSSICLAEKG